VTAAEVYQKLRAAGVELWTQRNRLFMRGPLEALQDGQLVELARDYRSDLGRALRLVETCSECRRPMVVLLVVVGKGGESRVCGRCAVESPAEAVEIEIKSRRAA
jgi:hypothetical protein